MNYPTLAGVEAADREQLCWWVRFLPSPAIYHVGKEDFEQVLQAETAIMDRIYQRHKQLGGFTPEISKKIGWEEL